MDIISIFDFLRSFPLSKKAVGRLGGQNMLDECKVFRTIFLGRTTVPGLISVQSMKKLEEWRMDNSNFIETRAAKHVHQCVQENNCVTITASSGVGKTATLRNVALKMADEGYNVLMITNPRDIVKFYNPEQKTLFVIDNFCGTYSISECDLDSLESVMDRIQNLIQSENIKIIVACRLQVYQDDKFESLSFFRTCVCNLLSDELCLSRTEKQSIAELYLETKASEIIQYCDEYDCFPLLCKLYQENSKLIITDFFKNPFPVYEAEIDKLYKNKNYKKYCTLALCVIFNNRLKEEWLTDEVSPVITRKIDETCVACGLERCTSRLSLLDELKSLEYTFIKKEKGIYKTLNDKLFDFLTYYFGQKMILCLIKNAQFEVIMQRFSFVRNDDMNQFTTLVPPEYHNLYLDRIIFDWNNVSVHSVFNNINIKIPEFRQRFFVFLSSLDTPSQIELAHHCDVNNGDTVLLLSCQYNDMPWIQWCLNHEVDVNQCNLNGKSPLYVSAHVGALEVVIKLLLVNADIHKCTNNGESPLLIACQKNHIEVVKVLLENEADINKCANNGVSPLHFACQYNLEMVKILLDNKADINKCANNGVSTLYFACANNQLETVNLLLGNNADIDKCGDDGSSPLFIACANNYIQIVKVLLEYKANIDKGVRNGTSPLCIACQQNHIEIVKILLDNKADINKCTDDDSSPLYFACANNHIEAVKLLLDNNADIDKCRDDGSSPLFIACLQNHIDIVKVLLEYRADIDKCSNYGISPLFIACLKNHIETVKVLLEYKADVDKCANDGASPLYIASRCNLEMVKILLDNKADINKCTNIGLSPLYFACVNNQIETVQLLLDNKADINKCTNNGESPLLIACQNNHIGLVTVLLDNKADTNKCDNDGLSPLYIACRCNVEMVKILLDNKADINKCIDYNGSSPLYLACANNHIETVKFLLDNNADINKCADDGSCPLLIALGMNHIETVKILLDYKAEINK